MSLSFPLIDHVLVNVNDQLDEAARQYARLGFTLTPRGHHSLGSSNHLAIFENDYLELLGYEPQNAGRVAGVWGTQQGLAGLIFKTDDADALVAPLQARGVGLMSEAAQAFHRPVELTDGTLRDARFRTLHLDLATTPSGRIFFCQHLDPDLVWHAPWQQHANGVYAVKRVVIASQDPEAASAVLARVFNTTELEPIEGGLRLRAGQASVEFLTLDRARAIFGTEIELGPEGADRKVGLELRTRSLQDAARALEANGVPFERQPESILVPASQAAGVALLLVE